MFEMVFPGENLFIVILKGNKHYVTPRNNVIFIKSASEIKEYLQYASDYIFFIIHYLRVDVAKILTGFHHQNYCWIEWGADLYNYLLEYKGFPMYEDMVLNKYLLQGKSFYPIALLRKKIGLYQRQKVIYKFAKNVKYFMPDSTPDELPLLLQYYPELSHLQYKEFYYYPIDVILGTDLKDKQCKGSNIVVNHSASPTGNHVGVFERLTRLDIQGRKVIVPISYGQDNVKQYIEKNGYEILGDSFEPIKEFMPLEEYNKLLLSANVFIYGHWRQEAVGNILVALFIGGKVFMSAKSPMYSYYKRLGLHLWNLDEINNDSINIPLDQSLVEENRKIIMTHYSKERLLHLIETGFQIVKD